MPTTSSDRARSSRRSFCPQLTQLEDRSTPAAITTAGTAATIDLNGISIGEAVTITTAATGDITVTSTQGVTLNGGLSAPTQTFSGAITVQVTDSTTNNTLTFGNSAVAYTATFTVVLDNSPQVTTFDGLSAFGSNALSVTTTSDITVNTNTTVSTTSGNITLAANQTILVDSGGTVESISGNLSLTADRNIVVNSGGAVTTTSGNITLSANVAGATTGNFIGIDVLGDVTSTSGAVSLTGHGGDDSSGSQVGIKVHAGGTVSTTGSGSVTLAGVGGVGGLSNYGVLVSGTGSAVTTGGGNVSVTGQGGDGGVGGDGFHDGVRIQSAAQVIAGGSGTVTVQGTGGTDGSGSSNGSNNGVILFDTAVVSSNGGSVTVVGTGGGGGGGGNHGGVIVTDAQISAGGLGTVSVTGTGGTDSGSGNNGVVVFNASGAITSSGGSVSVTGTGATVGVLVNFGGVVSSGGNAAVTVIADSIELFSTTSVNAGSGTVTLRPLTAGTPIDVGGADQFGPLTLGLTDAELDSVTAGALVIGGATAGNLTVTANVGPANAPQLALVTGGSISGTGTVTVTGLTLTAVTGIGSLVTPLNTTVGTITANNSGTGVIAISETDSVVVASTTQDGLIQITSGGTMTVGTVTAGGTGRDVLLQSLAGDIAFGAGGGVTAAGDAVRLIAAGAITESGAAVSVTALSLSASAGTAVGTVFDPLNADVFNLAATSIGGLFVTNVGSLTVASLTVFGSTVVGVTAVAGDLALTTAAGVLVLNAPVNALANITLTSDDLINAGSAVNAATGAVTIQPTTAGRVIDLGTNTAGHLGLTDAELDLVTAGTLIIGNSTAGDMNVTADISRSTPTNVQLISGGGIASTLAAGRISTAGGTLSVQPNTDFAPNRAGPDVTASFVVFPFATDLLTGISGTTVDSGYTQLNVVGSLDLSAVNLVLSGSYVPVVGDSFTVVSATSLTGTFAGLPNGAAVTFNGVDLRVFYTSTTATLQVNSGASGLSTGGPYTITEGAGLTVSSPATLEPEGDLLGYTWDVNGDGTFGDEAGGTVTDGGRTVTFTPAQLLALGLGDGAFSTTLLAVRTSDGYSFGTVTAFGSLTVSNVAPTVAVSGSGLADEGAVYTLNLGAVTDPGQDTVTQYRVNWGDGTSDTYTTAGAKTHTYADDGAYTVTVDLTDEDGAFTNVGTAHSVTVSNVLPLVTPPATVPSPDEGAATTFDLGSFTDPAGANDGPYTVQVDWGDGNSDTFTVAVPGSLGSLGHTYADNGLYVVTVVVSEAGGTPTGTNAFNVTVNNVAPTPTINGPTGGTEGTPLAFAATATDPAGVNDTLTFTWSVTKNGAAFANGTGPAFTFTPDDDGTYVLSLTAADGDGGVTTDTRTLPVTNVGPTITALVGPTINSQARSVSASAAAADPAGVNDPLTFAWVVTRGGVVAASGSGTAFTFLPTVAGSYNFTVTVSDGDGGTVSSTAGVVVPVVFVAPPLVFSNAGRVRVIDPTGVTRDLNPFPGFLGDVTVASADLNGDGVPEVVAGAGPGGGPHVVVFDGASGAVTASFFAYDVGFTGGVFVAATADGRIITGAGAFGGPHVKVIAYARTGQKLPNGQIADSALVTTFFAYNTNFLGGVRVAAGDVTGDGVADIVTGAGPGGGPHVKVYDGVTYAAVRSFYAFAPDFANGVYVAAATGWLAAGAGTWGGPHVRVYDDTGSERFNFFAYPTDFIGGVRVGFADVDADGVPDVIAAPGLGGGQPVTATRLSDLTTITSVAPFDPLDPLGVFVG